MSLSIDDLRPKPFKVVIKGVELECQPLRLSHALAISRIGELMQNSAKHSMDDIRVSEKELDTIISELIPELGDINLELSAVMQLFEQMMDHIQPVEDQELKKNNVKLDSDPKA